MADTQKHTDKGKQKQTTENNVRVEEVVHADQREEAGSSDTQDDRYEEITVVVHRQLETNYRKVMKQMENKAQDTINEAIKRALEKKGGQGSSKKKQKKEPDFKQKGNKIRYEINMEIMEKLETAKEAIEEKDLDTATKEIESGMDIVRKQRKLIRVADREDNGWEIVKHYLSDDLADDTDDEKAINKARKEALASIGRRRAKKKENFRNASRFGRQKFSRDEQVNRKWGAEKFYGEKSGSYNDTTYYGRKKQTICFRCGKEGHFMYVCPLKYNR